MTDTIDKTKISSSIIYQSVEVTVNIIIIFIFYFFWGGDGDIVSILKMTRHTLWCI